MPDPDCHRFEGRVAIVTGGTSGIGLALVEALVREGARVMVVARTRPAESSPLQALPGGAVEFHQGDVGEPETAENVLSATREALGTPTILVNCAAVDLTGVTLLDTEPSVARNVVTTNLLGPTFMLRAAASAMAETGNGAVVNLTSRTAHIGVPGTAVYGASKAGLLSLTRTAAVELAGLGIRVNAVSPGPTDTPMINSWIDSQSEPNAFRRELTASIPQGRLALAEEVAEAVLFLASDSAGHITGATLAVDGGYTAGRPVSVDSG